VFGLSIRTVERDLDDEFSRFGRVEKVTIVYDQRVRQVLSSSVFNPD
jgi:transformer-2 protein